MPMFQNPLRPSYGVAGPSAAPAPAAPSGGLFSQLDNFRQANPGVLASFGAALAARSPASQGFQQAAQMMQVNNAKNATAKYLLDKGLADSPEEAATLASNPALMQTLFKDNLIQDQFEARKKIAESMGLDPNDPQNRDYLLSGQYSGGGTSVGTMTPAQRMAEGQKMGLKGAELTRYALTGSMDSASSRGLNSTELKLKSAAEDALPALQSNLDALDQAESLLGKEGEPDKIYTGTGSDTMSRANVGLSGTLGFGIGMDPIKAENTKQFNDLLSQQAIAQMAETLKGATTNFELQEFKNILSDPNSTVKQRRAVIKRMRQLFQAKYQTYQSRVQSLSDTEDGTVAADPNAQAMPGGGGGAVNAADYFK